MVKSIAEQVHLVVAHGLTDLACCKEGRVEDHRGHCYDPPPWKVPEHPLGTTKEDREEYAAKQCQVEDPYQGPEIRSWCKASDEFACRRFIGI
ncbi:MAG: hypothetical protein ACKO9Q_24945, partial [Pirellula sp.]